MAKAYFDPDKIVIKTMADARKHIIALWNAHNAHCDATGNGNGGLQCQDPPETCGQFWKKDIAKKSTQKAAKKR
jgi:hypothetical protein